MSFFAGKWIAKIRRYDYRGFVIVMAVGVFAILVALLIAKYGGDSSSEGTLEGFLFYFF
jgi:hypothetical protein